ncbi:MAG: hypothetical protein QF415_07990 [Candidatus Undinarchaeales archaeon]|jgi:hypothetical protein|nr:hypothetical protein [Candidatus Undinarchaeales archaeon]MDP7492977.1 hypothetical protein [Candidatus Undinarchaeales archaeon]
MSDERITFVSRECPHCGEKLAVKWSGVWGYYCVREMFWWGKIDGMPDAAGKKAAAKPAPKKKAPPKKKATPKKSTAKK